MRRAEASGSSGSRQTVSGLGQVGAVDAGVGADEAVPGLDDQDAALGAQHLAALGEDQLDQRRLFAEHGGELARLGAGQHRGEAADAALGLGDDLLGDDDDVAVLELPARAAISSPSAIPSVTSGRPATGRTRSSPGAARSYSQGLGGPLGAARRDSSSRVRATTSAGVSRSSPSEASSSTAKGTPASRAAATWRAQLPSPKAGTIASGGLSTSALVPVPWRSGTIAT